MSPAVWGRQEGKPISRIFQDLRYACRAAFRQPGFALIVVITLGVGLAANASVFGVVDALMLRPFPLPDIDRLVQIWETVPARGEDRAGVSPANFLDWRRQGRSFEHLVAMDWWDASLSEEQQDPELVLAHRVSSGFFPALGVEPLHGRGFVADEEIPGRNHVAVISHRLWQRRWAGASALVGSFVSIDGIPHTVIGIAPEHFDYPFGTEIWAPLALDDKAAAERTRRSLDVIARLQPGVDTAAARAEMLAVAARLEREYKESNGGYSVNVMPLSRAVQDIGLPSVMVALQSAVVLVLLIAGANVANLLLVRGTARQKELALRLAIGASRWRVVRQFAGIGLFLAAVGIYGVMAYSVSQRTRELGVRIALGATARQVMSMTLRDTLTLTSAGVAVGLLAACALGKLMVANLFGVVQLDVITFIVFAGVLAVVAVIAGGVPARRAMRVDPIVALRTE